MKRLVLVFVLAFGFALVPIASPAQSRDFQRWEQQARNATIVRGFSAVGAAGPERYDRS